MLFDPVQEHEPRIRDLVIHPAFQKDPAADGTIDIADQQPEQHDDHKAKQRKEIHCKLFGTEDRIVQREQGEQKGSGFKLIDDRCKYTSGMSELDVSDIGLLAPKHLHSVFDGIGNALPVTVYDVIQDSFPGHVTDAQRIADIRPARHFRHSDCICQIKRIRHDCGRI